MKCEALQEEYDFFPLTVRPEQGNVRFLDNLRTILYHWIW